MSYDRRCQHLWHSQAPSRGDGVPGKSGSTVYRAGCNLNAAMYPVEPERHDPTAELLAELERQRRARQNT